MMMALFFISYGKKYFSLHLSYSYYKFRNIITTLLEHLKLKFISMQTHTHTQIIPSSQDILLFLHLFWGGSNHDDGK